MSINAIGKYNARRARAKIRNGYSQRGYRTLTLWMPFKILRSYLGTIIPNLGIFGWHVFQFKDGTLFETSSRGSSFCWRSQIVPCLLIYLFVFYIVIRN